MSFLEDVCLFSKFGWYSNGNFNEDDMKTDLPLFPASILNNMSSDKLSRCSINLVTKWSSTPKRRRYITVHDMFQYILIISTPDFICIDVMPSIVRQRS